MNVSKHLILSALLLLIMGTHLRAQYMFRNYQKAYEKGTRSSDGKPGANYWQNYARYDITASVDPVTGKIMGKMSAEYINNSPDTLKRIVMRIYPDLFRKGNVRLLAADPDDIGDGMNVTNLVINGETINITDPSKVTRSDANLDVRIRNHVPPGASATVEAEWDFIMPKKSDIRIGNYGDNIMFVGYWYPQFSVYDDLRGWDVLGYNGLHEFYNEFADFDVKITVPAGIMLWSTGDLKNASEVYTRYIIDKVEKAYDSDTPVRVITSDDLKEGKIFANPGKETTYRISAKRVPDFAFAVSDNYIWDAVGVTVDNKSGRRALVSAVYDEATKDYDAVLGLAQRSVAYFSTDMPGVPYPYTHMTVFQGSGGMEFPMMCNDGPFENGGTTTYVTSHEIAHTYFPFMTGVDEKRNAWMDEGMAVYLPLLFQRSEKDSPMDYRLSNASVLDRFAGTESEMPLLVPSNQLNGFTYQMQAYTKGAVVMEILEAEYGRDKMRDAFREFIKLWEGKHPTSYDMLYTFARVLGDDITWVTNPWFEEFGYSDLSILEASVTGKEVKLTISNKGIRPIHSSVTVTYEDGKTETTAVKPSVLRGREKAVISLQVSSKPKTIQLGSNTIHDANRQDNIYEVK